MYDKNIKDKLHNNGKMNKRLCNETRYKENEKHILEYINDNTKFISNHKLKEKIYCILNDIVSLPICKICNVNPCKFNESSKCKYNTTCSSKECITKYKSLSTSNMLNTKRWVNHKKQIKPLINKEERYKQAVNTRRKNNPEWFTQKQKEYKKIKTIEACSTVEHKLKMKEIWSNPDRRRRQSNKIKELIANNIFTPPITNTWTHWESIYNYNGIEYKFRSSWEAAFWSVNKHLKYETLRIPYIYLNKNHTYIVDFVDDVNKKVYEVKPKDKLLTKEKIKEQALIQWCNNNNYEYILINDSWFYNNYNNIDFKNNEWLIKRMKQFKK